MASSFASPSRPNQECNQRVGMQAGLSELLARRQPAKLKEHIMKLTLKSAIMTMALLVSATVANAQTATKTTLTIDGAKKVIAASVAYAKKNNAPGGVIAVVDDGGNLMAGERLARTFSAADTKCIGQKATT